MAYAPISISVQGTSCVSDSDHFFIFIMRLHIPEPDGLYNETETTEYFIPVKLAPTSKMK